MTNQTAIPFMQIRGGSSKGVYFRAEDLPSNKEKKESVLKWVIGAFGDPRQIDGLGGADPLTSKIAIVEKSKHLDCDIDYSFVQAIVGEDKLDDTPNCGNLLAGVGAFALESGLISAKGNEAEISVYMNNSGNRCDLKFPIKNGQPIYNGKTTIDGVYGTSAPVMCRYYDLAGSATGSILPTGYVCNEFESIKVTCVDNGMPVVCMRAEDFGLTGNETPNELDGNDDLKTKIESIRLKAGVAMMLGNVAAKAVPKMCLVSQPQAGGSFSTRTFIPKHCHKAIGVLGAVSVATAALYERSSIHDLAIIPEGLSKLMRIEHPSGSFDVELELNPESTGIDIIRAGLLRTARLISKGEVYVPKTIWQGVQS